jgi:hypothetical protein
MSGRIDRVTDRVDGAVTEDHVEPGGMRAAEANAINDSRRVLHGIVRFARVGRIVVGPPTDIPIVAGIHGAIVAVAGRVVVRVGAEILLPDQIGVARAIGDARRCDRAVGIGNPVGTFVTVL